MDKQTREAREMVKNLSFKDKVKHFWEYYRIHTIVVLVAAILIGVTVYQVATREKYDLSVAYYGAYPITAEQELAVEEYLSSMVDDIDGNGEKKVDFVPVVSDMNSDNGEYQMALAQKFMAEMAAAVHNAYIFDEEYLNYAGPESDMGVMESAVDLRESEDLAKILEINDEALYWCRCAIYEKNKNKEDKIKQYENIKRIEELIK